MATKFLDDDLLRSCLALLPLHSHNMLGSVCQEWRRIICGQLWRTCFATSVDLPDQLFLRRVSNRMLFNRTWHAAPCLSEHPLYTGISEYERQNAVLLEDDIPMRHADSEHSKVAHYAHRLLQQRGAATWIGTEASFTLTPCAAAAYMEACEWGLTFIHHVFDACGVDVDDRGVTKFRDLHIAAVEYRLDAVLDRNRPLPTCLEQLELASTEPSTDQVTAAMPGRNDRDL